MNYAAIKNCDIANGPGVRVSLFVSGCRHHCKDCFNPETWDFACGEPFDEAVMDKLLALLAPGYIRGITYLGGEPFGLKMYADGVMIVNLESYFDGYRYVCPAKEGGLKESDIIKENSVLCLTATNMHSDILKYNTV